MWLHIIMQLWYDWNSHPSAVWMMLYEALQIKCWRSFAKISSSSCCRSVALIRSTGSREIVCWSLCTWLVVLELLMYLLSIKMLFWKIIQLLIFPLLFGNWKLHFVGWIFLYIYISRLCYVSFMSRCCMVLVFKMWLALFVRRWWLL